MSTSVPTGRPEPGRPARTSTSGAQGSLFYSEPGVRLYLGDTATVLGQLPASTVDCVVTSPPYWRLRNYDDPDPEVGDRPPAAVADPYGLEPTAAAYVDRLRTVFAEIRRLLVPTGTVWLNLGDSYSTNSDGYLVTRPGHPRQPRYRPPADVPHKNLLGMPWKVAFALQADGWTVRNAVVWHKPNATPNPVADRFATRYELLFLLVRQRRYYFDLDPVRQPYTGERAITRRAHRGGTKPHTVRGTWPPPQQTGHTAGRNPGDVWTLPTRPARPGHPPAFPVDLPLRAVAAGCPPGGTVLDPFSGAGTTGVAARRLGRAFIGIDRSPTCHLAARQAFQELPREDQDNRAAT